MKNYGSIGPLIILTVLLCLLLTGTPSAMEPEKGREQSESAEAKVARLEREISELQDGMSLIMENLINCTEENEDLAAKLQSMQEEARPGEIDAKRRLVERVGQLLKTGEDLGFLLKLREDDLKKLITILTTK